MLSFSMFGLLRIQHFPSISLAVIHPDPELFVHYILIVTLQKILVKIFVGLGASRNIVLSVAPRYRFLYCCFQCFDESFIICSIRGYPAQAFFEVFWKICPIRFFEVPPWARKCDQWDLRPTSTIAGRYWLWGKCQRTLDVATRLRPLSSDNTEHTSQTQG